MQRGNINKELIEQMRKLHNISSTNNDFDLLVWSADIFHLIDEYQLAHDALTASEHICPNSYPKDKIIDEKLIKGHVILHLNEFENSKQQYEIILSDSNDLQKCEIYFRIGELELLRGSMKEAETYLYLSLLLSNAITEKKSPIDKDHIRASRFKGDSYRRLGTTYLMEKNLPAAYWCFCKAKKQYKDLQSRRGGVWLLHEMAEYRRQIGDYEQAKIDYINAIGESCGIFNTNRVFHGILGLAETNRLAGYPNIGPYQMCLEAYKNIGSKWGIINSNIGLGLVTAADEPCEAEKYLTGAKTIAHDFGFKYEEKVCEQILLLNKSEYQAFKYTLSHF